jgi:hypothetical protein
MIDHMYSKYLTIINKNFLKKNDNILDIGSNDGTFLNFFANLIFIKLALFFLSERCIKE